VNHCGRALKPSYANGCNLTTRSTCFVCVCVCVCVMEIKGDDLGQKDEVPRSELWSLDRSRTWTGNYSSATFDLCLGVSSGPSRDWVSESAVSAYGAEQALPLTGTGTGSRSPSLSCCLKNLHDKRRQSDVYAHVTSGPVTSSTFNHLHCSAIGSATNYLHCPLSEAILSSSFCRLCKSQMPAYTVICVGELLHSIRQS